MKVPFLFMFFLSVVNSSYGGLDFRIKQNEDNDLLKAKSFKELALEFWRGKKLDSVYKLKLAKTYIVKGKEIDNPIKIADGYQMIMYLYSADFETYLKYADSIIDTTKDLKNSHYPVTGYIFKGGALRDLERYNEALVSLLKAKELSEKNNSEMQILIAEDMIAELKTILGKDAEALRIYKKHFSILSHKKDLNKNDQNYITAVYNLADVYNKTKNYDSAFFYINKGIKYSLQNYHHYLYPEFVYLAGINGYHREKFKPAIDSLEKAIKLFGNNLENIKVRMSYLYLGKNHIQIKNDTIAFRYIKKVDSATNALNYRYEIREAFELLRTYYTKNTNRTELVKLLEKWIRYEKIREEKFDKLNDSIVEKYDIPKLVKEKEQLLNQTTNSSRNLKTRIIVLIFTLIIVFSALYFVYNRKKKKLEQAFNQQMKRIELLENKGKKSSGSSGNELSKELKQDILQKLDEFENNKEYLSNNLTLVKVSKKLRTNSTYLSKVINLEKKKNFTNYINDLRIEYCLRQIHNNNKFRQYSISSMAKEVGFNNIQSFAKAFAKKTKMNPAEYVKNVDC